MNFAESVRFLHSLGHELKVVKWGLERIETLLVELGNPHRGGRFIHVAGTNGKGSTCAMMASALRASGFGIGLYTSPHLINPRERIQIDGECISENGWCDAFNLVHAAVEDLLARDLIDAHPSFFETMTAMAFVAFARSGVDIVVLETGLGGRLDATNVVDPEVTVITPIDFDHEAFLGSSIESIAAEKAGIIKRGRPVVFAAQRPAAFSILERRALERDAPVTLSSSWRIADLHLEKFGSLFTLARDEEIQVKCPLAGEHQVENARTATAALMVFGLAASAIGEGIAHAVWPGRLERVASNPDIILDGAHNPAGARALAAYIERFFTDQPVRIVYGAMRDKAVDEVIGILFPLADEVVLTAPDQPRALNPATLAQVAEHRNLRIAPAIGEVLALIREKPMTTFITGSLFLVGEARAALRLDAPTRVDGNQPAFP
jgi:dihydrofolate synthase/folylpolyglutamate synthase